MSSSASSKPFALLERLELHRQLRELLGRAGELAQLLVLRAQLLVARRQLPPQRGVLIEDFGESRHALYYPFVGGVSC